MAESVRVWLGGEGPSELGNRHEPPATVDEERIGAIEALLRKVQPDGWHVAGAIQWRHIKKFVVGAARGRKNHGDIHSIAGLVNMAYEAGCPVVAFTRDVDADRDRVDAIRRGIEHAAAIPHLRATSIIGGHAKPAIEGWILALLGVRDTERMSRTRANDLLAERGCAGKHAEDYVAVVEHAHVDAPRLPPGCDGLRAWLQTALTVFAQVLHAAGSGSE